MAGASKKKEEEKEEESLVDAKDDLVSAHTWKPIKRSFLSRAPLENSGCRPTNYRVYDL